MAASGRLLQAVEFCLRSSVLWVLIGRAREHADAWDSSVPCWLVVGDAMDGFSEKTFHLSFEKKRRAEELRLIWTTIGQRRDAVFCDVVDFWRWSLVLERSTSWGELSYAHVFDFSRWSSWLNRANGGGSDVKDLVTATQALEAAPQSWWDLNRLYWCPTVKSYLIAEREPFVYGDRMRMIRYEVDSAVTGRSSCSAPTPRYVNPHSLSKKERMMFRPKKGRVFATLDFSSAEVCTLAMESRDPKLLEFFEQKDRDLYLFLAPDTWGAEKREKAKKCLLQFIYGASEDTISVRADVPLTEARDLIARFSREFEQSVVWMLEKEAEGAQNGGVLTRFGRAIQIKGETKEAGRKAVNYTLQSITADWNTLAFVLLQRTLNQKNLGRVFVHLHDGYVFEVPSHRADDALEAITGTLGNEFVESLEPWGGRDLKTAYKFKVTGDHWDS